MLFLEPDVDYFRIDLQRISLPNAVVQLPPPTAVPPAGLRENPLEAKTADEDKTKAADAARAPERKAVHAYEHVTLAERAGAIRRALLSTQQARFPYELPDTLLHVYLLVVTHAASPTFAEQFVGAEEVAALLAAPRTLPGVAQRSLSAKSQCRTFPSHMRCLLQPSLEGRGRRAGVLPSTGHGKSSNAEEEEEKGGSNGSAKAAPPPTTRRGTALGSTKGPAPQLFDSFFLLARDLSSVQWETYRQGCLNARWCRPAADAVATAAATASPSQGPPTGSAAAAGEGMIGFTVLQGRFTHHLLADSGTDAEKDDDIDHRGDNKRDGLDGGGRRTPDAEGRRVAGGTSSPSPSSAPPQAETGLSEAASLKATRGVAARSLYFSVYRIPLSHFEPQQQLYYTAQREKLRKQQFFSDYRRRRRRGGNGGEGERQGEEGTGKGAAGSLGWGLLSSLLGGKRGGGDAKGDAESAGADVDEEEGWEPWLGEEEEEEGSPGLRSLFAEERLLPEGRPAEASEGAAEFFQRCHQILTNHALSRCEGGRAAAVDRACEPTTERRAEEEKENAGEEKGKSAVPKPSPKTVPGPPAHLLKRLSAKTAPKKTTAASAAETRAEDREQVRPPGGAADDAVASRGVTHGPTAPKDADVDIERHRPYHGVPLHGVTRLLYLLTPCDCYDMVVSDTDPVYAALSSRASYRPHTVTIRLLSDLTPVTADEKASNTEAPLASRGSSCAKAISSIRTSLLLLRREQQQQPEQQRDSADLTTRKGESPASFTLLTSPTKGFLLATVSLYRNDISGSPKHKKAALGRRQTGLPSPSLSSSSPSSPCDRPPRARDAVEETAVVNLFSILSRSSLAQHKLRYGAIRPVVSVAVLEDRRRSSSSSANATGGGGASEVTSAAGVYGEGPLQQQRSSTYCCRGLVDHAWFCLPVQYTPEEQEAIQWMPVILGATDCISDVGYRSAVHLGVFLSDDAVRRRHAEAEADCGAPASHGLSPLPDSRWSADALPTRTGVEAPLRADATRRAPTTPQDRSGAKEAGGTDTATTASEPLKRPSDEGPVAGQLPDEKPKPNTTSTVQRRAGGIAFSFDFDGKTDSTAAPPPPPEKLSTRQDPPPSTRGGGGAVDAAGGAEGVASRKGGIAFEIGNGEKEQPLRRGASDREALRGTPPPRAREPQPLLCNPWDDVPVAGGGGRFDEQRPVVASTGVGFGARAGVPYDEVPVGRRATGPLRPRYSTPPPSSASGAAWSSQSQPAAATNWDEVPVGGGGNANDPLRPTVEPIVKDDAVDGPFFDVEVSAFSGLGGRPDPPVRMSHSFRSPLRRSSHGGGGVLSVNQAGRVADSPVRGLAGERHWRSPGPGRPTTMGGGSFARPLGTASHEVAGSGYVGHGGFPVDGGHPRRRADSPAPVFDGVGGGGGGPGVAELPRRTASVHPYNSAEESPFAFPQPPRETRFSTTFGNTPTGRPTAHPFDVRRSTRYASTHGAYSRYSSDPLNSPISALSASGVGLTSGGGRGAVGERHRPPSPHEGRGGDSGWSANQPQRESYQRSRPADLPAFAARRFPDTPFAPPGGTRDTLGGVANARRFCINEYNDVPAHHGTRVRTRGTTAMDPVWSRPTAEFSAASNLRQQWQAAWPRGTGGPERSFGDYRSAYETGQSPRQHREEASSLSFVREHANTFLTSPRSALLRTGPRPPLAPRSRVGMMPPLGSQRQQQGLLYRRSSFADPPLPSTATRGAAFMDETFCSAAVRGGARSGHDAYRAVRRYPRDAYDALSPSSSSSLASRRYFTSSLRGGVRGAPALRSRVDPNRLTLRERIQLDRQRAQHRRDMEGYERHLTENYMMGNDAKRAKFEQSSGDDPAAAAVAGDPWGLEDLQVRFPAAAAALASVSGSAFGDGKGESSDRGATGVDGTALSPALRELEEQARARGRRLLLFPQQQQQQQLPSTGAYTDATAGESVGPDSGGGAPSLRAPASRNERVLEEVRRRQMRHENETLESMVDAHDGVADGANVSFTLRDIANAFLCMPIGVPPERDVCSGAWQSDGVSYFLSSKPTRLQGGWESYLERLNLYQEPFYLRGRSFVLVLRVPHLPALRVCVAVHNVNDLLSLLCQAPLARVLPTREEAWVWRKQFAGEFMIDPGEDDNSNGEREEERRGRCAEEEEEQGQVLETRWFFGLFTTRRRVVVRKEARHGSPADLASRQESDSARKARCRRIGQRFMQDGLTLTWKHKLALAYAQARESLRSPSYRGCTSPLLTDPDAFHSRLAFLSHRIVAYAAVKHRINSLRTLRMNYISQRAEELTRGRVRHIADSASLAPGARQGYAASVESAVGLRSALRRQPASAIRETASGAPSSYAASPLQPQSVTESSGGVAMTFDVGASATANGQPPEERPAAVHRRGGVAFTVDGGGDVGAARPPPLSSLRVNRAAGGGLAVDAKQTSGGIALSFSSSPFKRSSTPPPRSFPSTPRPLARSGLTAPQFPSVRSAAATTRTARSLSTVRKREPFRLNRIGDGSATNLRRPVAAARAASHGDGLSARTPQGPWPENRSAFTLQGQRDWVRHDAVSCVQESDSLAKALVAVAKVEGSLISPPLTTVLRLVPHASQLVRGAGGGVVADEDAPLFAGVAPTPVEVHRQLEGFNLSVSQLQQLLQWQWDHYQGTHELTPRIVSRGSVAASLTEAVAAFFSGDATRQGASQSGVPQRPRPRPRGISSLSRVLLLSIARWSWLMPVDYEGWWRGSGWCGSAPRLCTAPRGAAVRRRGGDGPLGLRHRQILLPLLLLSAASRYPGVALQLLLMLAMWYVLSSAVLRFLGVRQTSGFGLRGERGREAKLRWPFPCGASPLPDGGRRVLDAEEACLPPKDERVTMLYRHAESTAEELLEERHEFPRQVLVTRVLQIEGLLCSLWSRLVLLLRGHSPVLSLLLALLLASYLLLFYVFVGLVDALAAGRRAWLPPLRPADALQSMWFPLLLESEPVVAQAADLLWRRVTRPPGSSASTSPPTAAPHAAETHQYYQNGVYYTYTAGEVPLTAPHHHSRGQYPTHAHEKGTVLEGASDSFRVHKMRESALGGGGQLSATRALASMRALWKDLVVAAANATTTNAGQPHGGASRYTAQPTHAVISFLLFAYVLTMCVPRSPLRRLWRAVWRLLLHDDALVRQPILSF